MNVAIICWTKNVTFSSLSSCRMDRILTIYLAEKGKQKSAFNSWEKNREEEASRKGQGEKKKKNVRYRKGKIRKTEKKGEEEDNNKAAKSKS